jgi:hypothetical protein
MKTGASDFFDNLLGKSDIVRDKIALINQAAGGWIELFSGDHPGFPAALRCWYALSCPT